MPAAAATLDFWYEFASTYSYPAAMRVGRRTVSLPLSAALSDADVADVVAAVRGTLAEQRRGRAVA